jgi:heat shock protein HslJ
VKTLLKKALPAGAVFMILVTICACASRQTAAVPPNFDLVIDKEWKLIEVWVENQKADFNRDALGTEFANFYTLKFQVPESQGQPSQEILEGTISGRAAPNNYRGPFKLSENQGISFNKMAATLMASMVEPEHLKENEYFAYLEGIYRWDVRDGRLELHGKDTAGKANVLVFSE